MVWQLSFFLLTMVLYSTISESVAQCLLNLCCYNKKSVLCQRFLVTLHPLILDPHYLLLSIYRTDKIQIPQWWEFTFKLKVWSHPQHRNLHPPSKCLQSYIALLLLPFSFLLQFLYTNPFWTLFHRPMKDLFLDCLELGKILLTKKRCVWPFAN